jgi:hypothetical protein
VSGSFHVPTNWVGGVRPQFGDDAIINVTGLNAYTVRVDNSAINIVNRLVVNGDASTQLFIAPGSELRVNDPINSVFSTGVITIGSNNSTLTSRLTFISPDSRLNGSGQVVLAGFPDRARAVLSGLSNQGSFIIGSNMTVLGAGSISSTTVLVNEGVVRANVDGGELRVLSGEIRNQGTLRAVSGALLTLSSTTNTGAGRVSTDETSRVEFLSSLGYVRGGELDSSAGGTIEYNQGIEIDSCVLKGRHVAGGPNPELLFVDRAGTLRNDGVIEFPASLAAVQPRSRMLFFNLPPAASTVDMRGTGTLRFLTPAGELLVDDSSLGFEDGAQTGTIRLPGQNVEGNVHFRSSVRVGRTLSPGLAAPARLGAMRFSRTLRMNAGSTIELDVQGATPAQRDVLEALASPDASLVLDSDVTLRVRLGGGYVPTPGEVQTLVSLADSTSATPITGTFASLVVENLPSGVEPELVYLPASIRVRWNASSTCNTIDFNNDGLFPDDTDLVDFLSVLAGGPCSNDPNCAGIDFNNDGLFPDDNDLVAFLRVLAGGAC